MLQSKEQMRKNIREKAAMSVRTQAGISYPNLVERLVNGGTAVTLEKLCEGETY